MQVEREIYYLTSDLQRNWASAATVKAGGIYGCPAPVRARTYLSCLLCRWGGSHGNNMLHLEIYFLSFSRSSHSFPIPLVLSLCLYSYKIRSRRDGKGLLCIPQGCQWHPLLPHMPVTNCVLLPTGAALLIRVFLASCLSPPAGTHFHCTSVATWYPHSPHPSLLTLWATPQLIQPISSINRRERGEKPQEDGWPWCSQLSPLWLTPLWAMALVRSQSTQRFNKHRLVACWSSIPPSHLDSHFISRETFLFGESNFFLLWPQLSTHFQSSSCIAPGKAIMT